MSWQVKLNNLNNWWKTCRIDNNKPVNIYKYFDLDKIKHTRILDVGCGRPKGTWYADKFQYYVGVDPNPAYDYIVKAKAEDLPFADKSFTNVLFMSTLQHVETPQKALSEIKRVCTDKVFASVYCSEPNDLILHSFNIDSVKQLFSRYYNIQRIEQIENVVYVEALCS
jgi:ubiquinone/menaquinone biosynthesis C-methylase UbiE